MSDVIRTLAEEFRKFPGIGPRQAERFVYYLLRTNGGNVDVLLRLISELRAGVGQCEQCYRYFPSAATNQKKPLCQICANQSRDHELLMIVEKDIDLDNVEKSKTYHGYYFALGNLAPMLDQDPASKIRGPELLAQIKTRAKAGLKEIILALAANTEGDHTTDFLKQYLAPLIKTHALRISTLGRGLSTGAELEYSDFDTLKNALKHRE